MAVAERVKSIIVEQLGVDEDEVTLEASFTDDLGADSLDIVELVMAFEEEFGIEIPDEEAEKISNVRDAIDLHREQRRGPELRLLRRAADRNPTQSSRDLELHSTPPRRRHRGGAGVPARGGHRPELGGPARRGERDRPHHPLRRLGAIRRASPARSRGSIRSTTSTRRKSRRATPSSTTRLAAAQFAMEDSGLVDRRGQRGPGGRGHRLGDRRSAAHRVDAPDPRWRRGRTGCRRSSSRR